MNFNDPFMESLGVIEKELSDVARQEADPVTFLNLQFALSEKNRADVDKPIERLSFEQIIQTQRDAYFNELKSKSQWAALERKKLWSEWNGKNYDVFLQHMIQNNGFHFGREYLDTVKARLLRSVVPEFNNSGAFLYEYFGKRNYWAESQLWLMENCFPSIHKYEANKSAYPYFVDYMENHPFPSSEFFDLAAKKVVGYGTEKYAEEMTAYLDYIADQNLEAEAPIHFYLRVPQTHKYVYQQEEYYYKSEMHFARPKKNPIYSSSAYENSRYARYRMYLDADPVFKTVSSPFRIASSFEREFERRESFSRWWWPRPKHGFIFVPKMGFIDPRFFLPQYVASNLTVYGFQEWMKRKIAEQQERARKRRGKGGMFSKFLQGIVSAAGTGDPWKTVGATFGGAMSALNPSQIVTDFMKNNKLASDVYREMNDFTGGYMDQMSTVSDIPAKWIRGDAVTEQDMMMALDLGIKAAVVAASGGTAVALIGVAAGQLQRGSWGDDEVGSLILQFAEIASIAYVADAGVADVVEDMAERVIVSQARQTLYNRTDLGETWYGTFMVEVGVQSGARIGKGEDWVDALRKTADEAAVRAAAKESPEAAMIMGAVIAIRDVGYNQLVNNAQSLTTPEQWFDNFSWESLESDIKDAWKGVDKSIRKKLIGLAIMVAAGKVKPEDALKMIGQTIAMRQIDKFYSGEPVSQPSTPELLRRQEALKQAQKAKIEEKLLNDVRRGKIPTPMEMTMIADSATVEWAWKGITEMFPGEAQLDAWKLQFKIGFPDWDFSIPGIKMDLEIPEYMKIGSTDVPDYLKMKVSDADRRKIEEAVEKKKRGMLDQYTWENILYAYLLSLWPPNVPLRPVGRRDGYYNYIDEFGNLKVRPPLRFPYDHPMLAHNLIKKRYNEGQRAYIDERNKEMLNLVAEYEKLTGESLDYTTLPSGEIVIQGEV